MSSSGLDVGLLRDAVRDPTSDVVHAARDIGANAARLGVPLYEVLDHVERAFAPDAPQYPAVRAAAVAWAEMALIYHADIACDDPLTSLATVPHIRARLTEIYRGAQRSGGRVCDVNALVVIEFPRSSSSHELELALRALDVAEVLKALFTGEETFAQLTPRRFAVLVSNECATDTTMSLLALLLDRMPTDHGQPRLWVERLPASVDGIAQVLAGLCE